VLAGRRPEPAERQAFPEGSPHKALLPVGGVPMILRVIGALQACPGLGQVVVSAASDDRVLLQAESPPGVLERASAATPSQSVAAALAEFGAPLLVTTADHALLTPGMIAHFLAAAPADADAVAGLARSDTVLAAYPATRRTWLRFRDGAFSGCNLFLLRTPEAIRAVRFWRRVEQHRKHPLAMARLIGVAGLLGFFFRALTLPGALRLLERRAGARLAVVELPFAEAAIDVDNPEDLALVAAIVAGRANAGPASVPACPVDPSPQHG
jgi:GTP:adenosylcobinamide-phosphate guanylyltransferase